MSRATEPAGRSGASAGRPGSAGRSARRSAPVQKCRPVAAITTTRTLRSSLARSSRSMIRSRCAGERALPTSGRLRVMRAIPAATSWRTWSSMGWSVMAPGTVRDAAPLGMVLTPNNIYFQAWPPTSSGILPPPGCCGYPRWSTSTPTSSSRPTCGRVASRRSYRDVGPADRLPPVRQPEARRRRRTSRSPAPRGPTSPGGSTRTTATRSSGSSPRPATRPTRSRCRAITYDEMRPGCWEPEGPPRRHGPQPRRGVALLPDLPALLRADLPARPRTRTSPLLCVAGLQRLDGRGVVRRQRRPADPAVPRPAVGRRAGGRRGPAQRGPRRARGRLLRDARPTSACRRSTPATGTRSSPACEETGTVVCMHIGSGTKMPPTSPDAPGRGRRPRSSSATAMASHDRLPVLGRARTASRASSCCTPRARSAGSPTCSSGPTTCGRRTAAGAARSDTCPEPPSTYYYRHVYGCFFKDRRRRRDRSTGSASTTSPSRPTTRTRTAPGRTPARPPPSSSATSTRRLDRQDRPRQRHQPVRSGSRSGPEVAPG